MDERNRHHPQASGNRERPGNDANPDAPYRSRQEQQWMPEGSGQAGAGWQGDRQAGSSFDDDRRERWQGRPVAGYGGGYERNDYGQVADERARMSGQTGSSYRDQHHAYGGGYEDDHRRSGGDRHDEQSYGGGYADSGRGYGSGFGDSQRGYRSAAHRHGGYGPATFDDGRGSGFRSFGADYGGRDFVNNPRPGGSSAGYAPQGGAASPYGRSQGADYGTDYGGSGSYGYGGGSREDQQGRGFLQRAGDEVASWFGNDEAARRREMDHRGRGPANYTRSDARILEDANENLTHDWRVDATNITVAVESGEITLNGTVDSREAKRRAEDCIDHISGVRHVQNNLRVQDRNDRFGQASSSSTTGASAAQSSTTGASSASKTADTRSGTASGSSSGTAGSAGRSSRSTETSRSTN